MLSKRKSTEQAGMVKSSDVSSPAVIAFAVGSFVHSDSRTYQVESLDGSGSLLARDIETGEMARLLQDELTPSPHAFTGDLARISEEEIARALRQYSVLAPFISQKATREDVERLAKELELKRAHIYGQLSKLRAAPHFTTLIRRPRGRGKGCSLVSEAVDRVIEKQVRAAVKARLPLTVKTIFEEVEADCAQQGLKRPCMKTVRSRIETLGPELLLRKKHGVRRARERVTAMPGTIPVTAPLDIVEVDHSPLDMFVVSSQDRVCIGRASLTVVIDTFSRAVLGFHLGLEPPSALTVALALTHAVLPKSVWLSERGLSDADWPCHGLMKTLRVDNAAEFRSPDFEAACARWGIEVTYRKRKEDGAFVERFIGTVQGWCSQEPGASGNDPKKKRREKDPREDAHMTLAEAEAWLARQIVRRYHLARHSSLGMAPLQAWRAGLIASATPKAIVGNEDIFLISFLPSVRRVINHDGVRLFNETYFSSEARAYVHPGIQRKVHYDPRCMGRAYVDIGEKARFIEIQYVDVRKEWLPKAEIEANKRRMGASVPVLFGAEERVAFVEQNRKHRAQSQLATNARRQEQLEAAKRLAVNAAPKNELPPPENQSVDDEFREPARMWVEGPL